MKQRKGFQNIDDKILKSALMYQGFFVKHYGKRIPIKNLLFWYCDVSLKCPCFKFDDNSDAFELSHGSIFNIDNNLTHFIWQIKKRVYSIWNHISNELTEEQIKELKSYYATYHRKCWGFKQATKHFRKMRLIGNSLSVIFATGGIVSAIATSGVALVAVSTVSILIQSWMKHQNLDLKIQNCIYAYQSYQHLLDAIKDALRTGHYEANFIYTMMNNIDGYVIHNSPLVDKYLTEYDKRFIQLITTIFPLIFLISLLCLPLIIVSIFSSINDRILFQYWLLLVSLFQFAYINFIRKLI